VRSRRQSYRLLSAAKSATRAYAGSSYSGLRTNRGFPHADPVSFVYELDTTTQLDRSLHDTCILTHFHPRG
ncbi:MAG TPA: hypothetical protein VMG82_18255, partial [Candidatus Sulfotelmatobacter sp.]|nr:hypothetical protein [Candidatus Sulfotelmatobacter sp.]